MDRLDEHWKIINAGGLLVSNTPEQLWHMAAGYFQWCDSHPIVEEKLLTSGKQAGQYVVNRAKRPYTIKGMCLHCNISERYINDIKASNTPSSEYYMVMEKILMIIHTQNLEGAIANVFNPIIVSKTLNMDKGEENNSSVKIEIIHTDKQLANSESEILKKLDSEKQVVEKDSL